MLTELEIHHLGMNYIGEILQEDGYEFIAINSKLKKHPQYVCFKEGESTLFVLVKTVLFPQDPDLFDEKLIQQFKEHAKDKDARVWYVGVSLSNDNDITEQLMKGDAYKIKSSGFKKIL